MLPEAMDKELVAVAVEFDPVGNEEPTADALDETYGDEPERVLRPADTSIEAVAEVTAADVDPFADAEPTI